MRHWLAAIALTAAIGVAASALAQQPSATWLPLPRPAESGKPIIWDPQYAAKADDDQRQGCSPGWQCRLQLFGVIEHNGAVELKASAFSW